MDVVIAEQILQVFHGAVLVATHVRSTEPFARVVDPAHYEGLWRRPAAGPDGAAPAALSVLGRDLAEYAAIVTGGGQ